VEKVSVVRVVVGAVSGGCDVVGFDDVDVVVSHALTDTVVCRVPVARDGTVTGAFVPWFSAATLAAEVTTVVPTGSAELSRPSMEQPVTSTEIDSSAPAVATMRIRRRRPGRSVAGEPGPSPRRGSGDADPTPELLPPDRAPLRSIA
jgi:hypothetical protein